MRPGTVWRALLLAGVCALCRGAAAVSCANGSHVHAGADGGTAVPRFIAILEARVQWPHESTRGAAALLAEVLLPSGYTYHSAPPVSVHNSLRAVGVLRAATPLDTAAVRAALLAVSGADHVQTLHTAVVGTTSMHFDAVLESSALACTDMQYGLARAQREGLVQSISDSEEHLRVVLGDSGPEHARCTSSIRVEAAVLDCAHAPVQVPAWVAGLANVTVQAHSCAHNGTVHVEASDDSDAPQGSAWSIACPIAPVQGIRVRAWLAAKVALESLRCVRAACSKSPPHAADCVRAACSKSPPHAADCVRAACSKSLTQSPFKSF